MESCYSSRKNNNKPTKLPIKAIKKCQFLKIKMTKKGIKREAEDEPEDPIAVLSSPPASARSSGGMSLRPGRRVKVYESERST